MISNLYLQSIFAKKLLNRTMNQNLFFQIFFYPSKKKQQNSICQTNQSVTIYNIVKQMHSKMMLPIELTKILYSEWEGQITVSSQDSQIYGKCLNGPGSVTFKNGNKYSGNFYNGLLSGKGKFTWVNGIVYEGQFNENRITGKGIYKWPDGSIYQGEVKDGLRHGYGKLNISEATYQGQWFQGKKQGKGKIAFKSGSIFEGQFYQDMKSGKGKMYYYPSGNYFQGEWKRDMKQGYGTMNWIDIRQKYFGQWHENLQHGKGVHLWLQSKGEGKYLRNRYEGDWAKGVREGFGTFYYANGSKYEGYWKNNMKQGYSLYTNQNGLISHIFFDKDRMIKNDKIQFVQGSTDAAKKPAKKEVQPNAYSLSLNINRFYEPQTPDLQLLFNYLLRNNTLLKNWYKGISNFYDQQSEYSFALNLEGAWKMIKSLKILGDFSLANLNRGLDDRYVDVQKLLTMIDKSEKQIHYQTSYYKSLAKNLSRQEIKNNQIDIEQKDVPCPIMNYNIHNKAKNLLFRQFVLLLVWIAYNIDPSAPHPKNAVEKLINKISPALQTLSKAVKSGGMGSSDNMSQNFSSTSKAEKAITPHFRKVNSELLNYLKYQNHAITQVPEQLKQKKIMEEDTTIKMRQLLGYGIESKVFGQAQFVLLQRIIDKYMDTQVLNRQKSSNWETSTVPAKLLNILNYQFIEYEFIQIIYFLIIKKLPSHKETEENKAKYQQFLQDLAKAKDTQVQQQKNKASFIDEKRYLHSNKAKAKIELQKKRAHMQAEKEKRQAKKRQKSNEALERQLMSKEDFNVKDEDFQEQSELQI